MLQTVDYIKLGLAVFCAFSGASFQFVNVKGQEGATWFQRLVSLLVAVLLIAILAAMALLDWGWNTSIVCLLSVLFGLGAQKFLRLLVQYYEESNGLLDFISRLRAGYDAFKKSDPSKPN